MTNLWEVIEMNTALYDYAKKLRLGKDFLEDFEVPFNIFF